MNHKLTMRFDFITIVVLSFLFICQPESTVAATTYLTNTGRTEAPLSMGYKAYQQGDFKKAIVHLEAAKKKDLLLLDYTLYYLGEAYLSIDKSDAALKAFTTCIKNYPKSPLAYPAMEKIGDIFMVTGDIVNAIESYNAILVQYPNNTQISNIIFKMAYVLISNNKADEAIPFIKRLLIEFPQMDYPMKNQSDEKIFSEQTHTSLRLTKGDENNTATLSCPNVSVGHPFLLILDSCQKPPTETFGGKLSAGMTDLEVFSEQLKRLSMDEFYTRVWNLFKAGAYKQVVGEIEGYLFDLGKGGIKGGTTKDKLSLLMGKSLLNIKEYKKANDVFKGIIFSSDDVNIRAEILIWIARTHIKLKNLDSAEKIFNAFITIYTNNTSDLRLKTYREEAIYRLAMIAKDKGDTDRTVTLLWQLLTENPSAFYKDEGLWQISWIYYTEGDIEGALEVLTSLEGSKLRMRSLYWQAKISFMLGRKAEAIRLFKTAADNFPPTYYSAMSKKALEKIGDDIHLLPIAFTNNKEIIERVKKGEALSMKRARRLLEIGLNNLSLKELAAIDLQEDPLGMSLLYKEAGDIYHSYIIARNQFYKSPESLPYQLVFPKAYKNLVEKTSIEFELDSLLIYAMMMQESAFDERIVSKAGATGLLQIMPATGKMVAQKVSYQSFKEHDLFEPSTNINFGGWYLNMLISRYDGNLPSAIAAYNAGPTAVDKWLKKWSSNSMDEFIENIPFKETRQYVEKVMGYYEAYKTIYRHP